MEASPPVDVTPIDAPGAAGSLPDVAEPPAPTIRDVSTPDVEVSESRVNAQDVAGAPETAVEAPAFEDAPEAAVPAAAPSGEVEMVQPSNWNDLLAKERAMRGTVEGADDDPWQEIDATAKAWMKENFRWQDNPAEAMPASTATDDQIDRKMADYDRKLNGE